jgi:hypothetical protein
MLPEGHWAAAAEDQPVYQMIHQRLQFLRHANTLKNANHAEKAEIKNRIFLLHFSSQPCSSIVVKPPQREIIVLQQQLHHPNLINPRLSINSYVINHPPRQQAPSSKIQLKRIIQKETAHTLIYPRKK